MLESKYFSALPAGENAPYLLKEYRNLLIVNMIELINSIQKTTKIDLTFLVERYSNVDISKNFSPAIYSLFSKLSIAAAIGKVPQLIDVLHQLRELKDVDIYDSSFRISTILTENWETDFINKLRAENFPNKSGESTLILPILSPGAAHFETTYLKLKGQLEKIDFPFYQELNSHVTRLKLFNGKALKAATSASVYGAIYLRLPPSGENVSAYFADHIIHETSHLQLDILLAFDKIILNDSEERFKAPIRIDPRPMFGIFHATFVLSRMVRLFQRIMKDTPSKEVAERLDLFRRQFDEGWDTIEKHAVLTPNGSLVKDSLPKTAEI